jgi:ATP-binding cassette subfamily F protein uup
LARRAAADAGTGLSGTAQASASAPAAKLASRGTGQDWKAKKELDRLDRRLEKLTTREGELHELLVAHATDYEKLLKLNDELKSVQAQREQVEEEWLVLADDLA